MAGDDPDGLSDSLEPLFECIVREVAPPSVRLESPLQMLVTNLDCEHPPPPGRPPLLQARDRGHLHTRLTGPCPSAVAACRLKLPVPASAAAPSTGPSARVS